MGKNELRDQIGVCGICHQPCLYTGVAYPDLQLTVWKTFQDPGCDLIDDRQYIQVFRRVSCWDCKVAEVNRRIEEGDYETKRKLRGRRP